MVDQAPAPRATGAATTRRRAEMSESAGGGADNTVRSVLREQHATDREDQTEMEQPPGRRRSATTQSWRSIGTGS